jgi:predicted amidophosphoribosyltransferase
MGKQAQGIYLISKITKKEADNRIIAKVLCYDQKKPLMSESDFEQIYKLIFNRPRGSVFAIPTFLDNVFDKLLHEKVSSDIVISENIDCNACFNKKEFPCDKCSIFDRDYLINWQREVQVSIPAYEGVVSPFWIIPRQSHWTKTSISQHIVSRIFYSFKSGYTLYGRLFARGIKKAIENDPLLQQVKFDCILGVPLSPRKRSRGETDRVGAVCSILATIIGVRYLPHALSLSGHISRREYRYSHTTTAFMKNYGEKLELRIPSSLDNKNVLVIDDVITDGKTLQTIGKKIKAQYPNSHLFAATCGIFLKKPNASDFAVKKFKR